MFQMMSIISTDIMWLGSAPSKQFLARQVVC